MTGACYWCAWGKHEECEYPNCTCCGKRHRKHEQDVKEAVEILRSILKLTPNDSARGTTPGRAKHGDTK